MRTERCMIHLVSRRFKQCNSTDVRITIYKDGERIPLCWRHWLQLAKSNHEWSSR
jgi:hypothetical protein